MTAPDNSTTHLADTFKYCPRCARPILSIKDQKVITCSACGLRYFHNVAVAAAAIIEHENKILFVVRAHDPGTGLLDLPGGFVEPGESIEQTLTREIREELNLELTDMRYFTSAPNIYPYEGISYPVLDFFFTCKPKDLSTITASNELTGCRFLTPAELTIERLAFQSSKSALKQYIQSHL